MIVNIAGTSGAGKTTLAKALLARATEAPTPVRVPDRNRALGLTFRLEGKEKPVFIVGDYEDGLQTCGCDTIKDVARVYDVVEEYHRAGSNVVYEGLFVMNHTRGPELVQAVGRGQVTVLRLLTPLAQCKQSVNDRRAAQGKPPMAPDKWANTEGNDVRARNFAYKMEGWGAVLKKVTREEALDVLLGALE